LKSNEITQTLSENISVNVCHLHRFKFPPRYTLTSSGCKTDSCGLEPVNGLGDASNKSENWKRSVFQTASTARRREKKKKNFEKKKNRKDY